MSKFDEALEQVLNDDSFENELGNQIRLKIEAAEIEGVPGVNIMMEGPDSTMSNVITMMEAKKLEDLLRKFLEREEQEAKEVAKVTTRRRR